MAKERSHNSEMSFEERMRRRVERYNNTVGILTGYNCSVCKNKGDIMYISDSGNEMVKPCECMKARKTLWLIEKSGLKDLIQDYTFDKFKATSEWQAKAKHMAKEFLVDHENKWFFMGGQVGCGKTHLCTAIVGEFIRSGKAAHYMLWRDEIVPLKASVTDDEVYGKAIRQLKEVDVLYIDDFFKTERGKIPTTAEINIAFEILNYRYNNRRLITIISSEKMMDDIIDIDEAVGSRIFQRSKNYCLSISEDRSKNYRLNGGSTNG